MVEYNLVQHMEALSLVEINIREETRHFVQSYGQGLVLFSFLKLIVTLIFLEGLTKRF